MKAMVGLVIAIILIFGYRLFWPSAELESLSSTKQETVNKSDADSSSDTEMKNTEDVISSSQKLNAPSDKEKRILMRAEYEVLEKERKDLKRHIALLKHKMWGLKFPSGVARNISATVMSANKLLKNPYMLGAFSSVEQIQDEVAKIEFAKKSLVEIDELVAAKIEEMAESTN